MTIFRTVLEPTGGNNVGIVVPEETKQTGRGAGDEIEVELVVDPER